MSLASAQKARREAIESAIRWLRNNPNATGHQVNEVLAKTLEWDRIVLTLATDERRKETQ